jgi:hypothetical protein
MRTGDRGALALLACSFWAVGALLANPITIKTPTGGTVKIKVTYFGGGSAETQGVDGGALDADGVANGSFTFTPPNQSQVSEAEIVNIGVIGTPVGIVTVLDFGTAGMDAFGSFDFPEFSDSDGGLVLVTNIDVGAFTASPSFFTPGDTVPVTSGSVGLPGVVLQTAGPYLADSFFDVFFEIDLPPWDPWTGTALAQSNGSVAPEPAAWLLLSAGLVALAWKRRKPAQLQ